MSKQGLLERLKNGDNVVIAEGYMWEFERRGYLQFGSFVPEIVLEHPEVILNLHEEFVHAGSDVVLAFTYYANQRLGVVGRDNDIKEINIRALNIARDVAKRHNKLFAAGLSNTTIYDPDKPEVIESIEKMFKEQVEWFVDAGVDYIIGETFNDYGEALLALQAIQKYGKGLPAVITLAIYCYDKTTDDVPAVEACKRLEDAGAAVVGLNCARGPETMMPLIKEIRKVCKGPIAALPVMYRTTNDAKTFQALRDPTAGKYSYVEELSVHSCGRSDIKEFAEEAKQIGLQYVGLCCGNAAHCLRIVAETFGRTPPASRYKPDMSKSMLFRDNDREPSKIRKHMLGL